jgi:CBS-domain-containing membrane protein
MTQALKKNEAAQLVLDAVTAADLMSENPVSVRADATVAEAVDLLTRRGYSAAPVIDLTGRAVGVVSRSDVLVHDREQLSGPSFAPSDSDEVGPTSSVAHVRDIMTPVVFSVTPDTPAADVVKQMLDWKVHHLFVIDKSQVLIGVIGSLDILKRLHR